MQPDDDDPRVRLRWGGQPIVALDDETLLRAQLKASEINGALIREIAARDLFRKSPLPAPQKSRYVRRE